MNKLDKNKGMVNKVKQTNNEWKKGSGDITIILVLVFLFIICMALALISKNILRELKYKDFINDKKVMCKVVDKSKPESRKDNYLIVLECDNSKENNKIFEKEVEIEEYYQYEIGDIYENQRNETN